MWTGLITVLDSGSKIILIKKGNVPIETIEKTIDNKINKKYNPILDLYPER